MLYAQDRQVTQSACVHLHTRCVRAMSIACREIPVQMYDGQVLLAIYIYIYIYHTFIKAFGASLAPSRVRCRTWGMAKQR